MKKYIVIEDCCFGPKGRRWYKDSIAEFEDDITPPRFFKPMDGYKPPEKKEEDQDISSRTYSGIQKKRQQLKTGMAYKSNVEIGQV